MCLFTEEKKSMHYKHIERPLSGPLKSFDMWVNFFLLLLVLSRELFSCSLASPLSQKLISSKNNKRGNVYKVTPTSRKAGTPVTQASKLLSTMVVSSPSTSTSTVSLTSHEPSDNDYDMYLSDDDGCYNSDAQCGTPIIFLKQHNEALTTENDTNYVSGLKIPKNSSLFDRQHVAFCTTKAVSDLYMAIKHRNTFLQNHPLPHDLDEQAFIAQNLYDINSIFTASTESHFLNLNLIIYLRYSEHSLNRTTSVLRTAIEFLDYEIVQILLEKGANPIFEVEESQNPLFFAFELLNSLTMALRAFKNQKPRNEYEYSLFKRQFEIIVTIIKALLLHSDLSGISRSTGEYLVQIARNSMNCEIYTLLLENGAIPDERYHFVPLANIQ